jgi:MFS family permease
VAIIREIAPPDRRGEAYGRFDLLTSTSAAVGPFVGGVLIGAFGWRSIFYVCAPIAIASAVAVWNLLPGEPKHDPATGPRSIDVPGLVVLGTLIAAILIALRVGSAGIGLAAFRFTACAAFLAVGSYAAPGCRPAPLQVPAFARRRPASAPPSSCTAVYLSSRSSSSRC